MRNTITIQIVLFYFVLTAPAVVLCQDSLSFELTCKVHTVFPPLSISPQNLNEIYTISDLNKFYKSSWIREFISVDIEAQLEGINQKATSNNDLLTVKQKELIEQADFGADISVNITYIPNNTLTENVEKIFDFTFTIDPAHSATFVGGDVALNQYLTDAIVDKINPSSFRKHHLTAVQFTVDKDGVVTNPSIFESSKDKATDDLLLNAILKMPCWQPASYSNGHTTKQHFVLTIGDRNSCVINLLNIRDSRNN